MTIKMFGIAKQIAGNHQIIIPDYKSGATVGELKQFLSHQYPALHTLKSWAIAVDAEYADDNKPIDENSEVALLPPVSGG